MKKNEMKDQKRKPHRLSLSRETLRSLEDPALLEQARAGLVYADSARPRACCQGTSDTHQDAGG